MISARIAKAETGRLPSAKMELLVSGGGFAGPRNPNTCRRGGQLASFVLRETCQPARLLIKAMTTRGKQCVTFEATCKTVPVC